MVDDFFSLSRILMTEAYTSFANNLRYYGRVENGEIVEYGEFILIIKLVFSLLKFLLLIIEHFRITNSVQF